MHKKNLWEKFVYSHKENSGNDENLLPRLVREPLTFALHSHPQYTIFSVFTTIKIRRI